MTQVHALRIGIEPELNEPRLRELLRSGLARELRALGGLNGIEPIRRSTLPVGAKSGSAYLGGLVVSGALTTAMLTSITKVVLAWLARSRAREVILDYNGQRLVLKATSQRHQEALAAAWVTLVAQGPAPRPDQLSPPAT